MSTPTLTKEDAANALRGMTDGELWAVALVLRGLGVEWVTAAAGRALKMGSASFRALLVGLVLEWTGEPEGVMRGKMQAEEARLKLRGG